MSDRSLVRFPGVSWTGKKLQGWVEWLTLVRCGCNSACKNHTHDHFKVIQGPITELGRSKSFSRTFMTKLWWGFPEYLELAKSYSVEWSDWLWRRGRNSACKNHTHDHCWAIWGPITVFDRTKSFLGTFLTKLWWGFPEYLELASSYCDGWGDQVIDHALVAY